MATEIISPEATVATDRPAWHGLFMQAPAFHLVPVKALWAFLAVIAGAALSLMRVGGPGALNSIWAEDGREFMTAALNMGTREALATPINGYFLTGPRIMAEIASRAPIEYAAAVLTIEAALSAAILGLIVYVASAAYLRQTVLRLLVSVPAVIIPVSVNMSNNNVATLQFFWLYAMFWALLWRPSSKSGRVVAVTVVLLGSLTTPLALGLLPLALLRIAAVRDKLGMILGASVTIGVAAQLVPFSLGWTSRGVTTPRYDIPWVLGDFATKALPQAVFGERWMGASDWLNLPEWTRGGHSASRPLSSSWHAVLVVLAWLIAIALVAYALKRREAVNWSLTILAFGHSVGLFALQGLTGGSTWSRYAVAPVLLILTAAAALLSGSKRLPQLAFLALIAVVCIANFRAESFRTYSRPWTQVVQEAREKCADPQTGEVVVLTGMPQLLWDVKIPCYKVR